MLGSDEGGTEGGRAMWLKAGVDWHNQTWQKECEQPSKAPPGWEPKQEQYYHGSKS